MAHHKTARDLRAPAIEPEEAEPTVIQLATLAEWDTFAEENAEALIEEFGNLGRALQLARDGGFTIGGGAAPEFLVCFEDRP